MLLAEMENYSSLVFPSLPMDDSFPMGVKYDDGLFGRKRKKKSSIGGVKECRLDSPCNSPEMVVSALIDEGDKHHPKLFHSDSFMVDGSGTFSPVDMEGFYEISNLSGNCYGGSMTASEDIMLSSSSSVLKDLVTGNNLPAATPDEVHSVSPSTSSASESRLELEFDRVVDELYSGKDLELSVPAHDLLDDFSYLLSDIPSHPDLSCDDSGVMDSLLTYCNDKNDCTNTSHASELQTTFKEEPLCDIKCEKNDGEDFASSADCSDFDLLCKHSLDDDDDIDTQMYDYSNVLSCGCRGHDCLCFKYDSASAEEDVAVEYILSQRPSQARNVKRRRTNGVRRGPGRPRKYEYTEFVVRRGPGRPRKKSVSDAVVWYQSRRKRTVSFSRSRSRQKSTSDDHRAAVDSSMLLSPDSLLQLKGSNRRDAKVSKSMHRFPSSHSSETDEEDIVDVESIGEEFQEIYGVSTMAELVQHIGMMHSYHTQRFMPRHAATPATDSTSKFSINLAMPAKGTTRWPDDGRRSHLSTEARSKREALNDLERRRRYALARELSALRAVVPEMREGFRAAKVVILAAAENHIRLLERRLRRDQGVLKAERERHATLTARLQALSTVCK